jgi:hypothetical protein
VLRKPFGKLAAVDISIVVAVARIVGKWIKQRPNEKFSELAHSRSELKILYIFAKKRVILG